MRQSAPAMKTKSVPDSALQVPPTCGIWHRINAYKIKTLARTQNRTPEDPSAPSTCVALALYMAEVDLLYPQFYQAVADITTGVTSTELSSLAFTYQVDVVLEYGHLAYSTLVNSNKSDSNYIVLHVESADHCDYANVMHLAINTKSYLTHRCVQALSTLNLQVNHGDWWDKDSGFQAAPNLVPRKGRVFSQTPFNNRNSSTYGYRADDPPKISEPESFLVEKLTQYLDGTKDTPILRVNQMRSLATGLRRMLLQNPRTKKRKPKTKIVKGAGGYKPTGGTQYIEPAQAANFSAAEGGKYNRSGYYAMSFDDKFADDEIVRDYLMVVDPTQMTDAQLAQVCAYVENCPDITCRFDPPISKKTPFIPEVQEEISEILVEAVMAKDYELDRCLKKTPLQGGVHQPNFPTLDLPPNKRYARVSFENSMWQSHVLSKDDIFSFGNSLDRGFTASSITINDIAIANGIQIPGATVPDAVSIASKIASGSLLHPKRFGDGTTVIDSKSNKIVTLTEENFKRGNTLLVFTPLLNANKGTILAQMPGGDDDTYVYNTTGNEKTIIAVVAPDRDIEELGTAHNNLFVKKTISVPTIIGGTDTVTAQISLEQGHITSNPLALLPGKMASLAQSRDAPIRIIGVENHSIHAFTVDVPTNQVRNFSGYDSLNAALSRKPLNGLNPAIPPYSAVEGGQSFVMHIANGEGQGWRNGVASIPPSFTSIPMPSTRVMWDLAEMEDVPKHFLYGHFTLNVCDITYLIDGVSSTQNGAFLLIIRFADNSLHTYELHNMVKDAFSPAELIGNFTALIHSENLFDAFTGDAYKPGVPIADMRLELSNTTAIGTIDVKVLTGLSFNFHSIAAATSYLVSVLTGAQVGAQINIQTEVHTEVRIDPSTTIATYLNADRNLPYGDTLAEVIQIMQLANKHGILPFTAIQSRGQAASDFGPKVRDFFRKAAKAARVPLSRVAGRIAPGMGGEFVDAMYDQYQAATFSAGASSGFTTTGFSFPIVKTEGNSALVHIVPIVRNSRPVADRQPHLSFIPPESHLTTNSTPYDGASDGLAFLLAYLRTLGYEARPGIYTGCVKEVYASKSAASFYITPVAMTNEKSRGVKALDESLTGMTATGWMTHGKLANYTDRTLFGPSGTVTHEKVVYERRPAIYVEVRK